MPRAFFSNVVRVYRISTSTFDRSKRWYWKTCKQNITYTFLNQKQKKWMNERNLTQDKILEKPWVRFLYINNILIWKSFYFEYFWGLYRKFSNSVWFLNELNEHFFLLYKNEIYQIYMIYLMNIFLLLTTFVSDNSLFCLEFVII